MDRWVNSDLIHARKDGWEDGRIRGKFDWWRNQSKDVCRWMEARLKEMNVGYVQMDEGIDHGSIGQQRSKQRNRYQMEKEKTK